MYIVSTINLNEFSDVFIPNKMNNIFVYQFNNDIILYLVDTGTKSIIKSNITNELNKRNQKNQGKYDYDLIPVHSAFNGFAIYKTSMFLNCSYSSMIHINLFPKHLIRCKIVNDFKNDCEHRKFHLEAIKKNGARIMVSPLSIFYKLPVPNPKLRGPA